MRVKRFETSGLVLLLVGIVWVGMTSTVMIGAPQQEKSSAVTSGAPTFSADVAPIVYTKCVACHRPGGACRVNPPSHGPGQALQSDILGKCRIARSDPADAVRSPHPRASARATRVRGRFGRGA